MLTVSCLSRKDPSHFLGFLLPAPTAYDSRMKTVLVPRLLRDNVTQEAAGMRWILKEAVC